MAEKLIPKGFIRIAESELLRSTTEVFWNKDRGVLLVVSVEKQPNATPTMMQIAPIQLESLVHCLKDVSEMKGNYYGPV